MKTPTAEEVMQAYDHATLAKRVIKLELAFAKLIDTPCSGQQIEIIKDAFPIPPIGHALVAPLDGCETAADVEEYLAQENLGKPKRSRKGTNA